MTDTKPDDITVQRRLNSLYHSYMAKNVGALFAGAALMGGLSYSGHTDLQEITDAERTSAMQSCMITVAAEQIRSQTTLARNGAIVVIDGGNPAVEECIEKQLQNGEPAARRGTGAFFGSLIGGFGAIAGIVWAVGGTRNRRTLNEKIRNAAPRP